MKNDSTTLLRCLVAYACPLICFLIFASYVVPLFARTLPLFGLEALPYVMMAVVYLATTALVQSKPRFFSSLAWRASAIGMVPVATLVIVLACKLDLFLLLQAGTCLFAVGVAWLGLYVSVTLCGQKDYVTILSLSFAYPVTMGFFAAIKGVASGGIVLVCLVFPLVAGALSWKSARGVLDLYKTPTSLSDLRITNPLSFVPFTSRLFGCVFFFTLCVGTQLLSVLSPQESRLSFLPWIVFVAVCVACCIRKKIPSTNSLYFVALLFTVFALLFSLGFPGKDGMLAYEAALCGLSTCEIMFTNLVLMQLGKKNPLQVIPALSWGRAAMEAGLILGIGAQSVNYLFSSGGSQSYPILEFLVAFIFISYNLVAMKILNLEKIVSHIQKTDFVAAPRERLVSAPDTLEEPSASPDAPEKMLDRDVSDYISTTYHLTPRELEIYNLLARGRNARYIETTLCIARNTVKAHIRNIYAKAGVHSQQDLINQYEQACERLS